MNSAIMLLGTLVPILAASVYYIGDRRAARPQRAEIARADADKQVPLERD